MKTRIMTVIIFVGAFALAARAASAGSGTVTGQFWFVACCVLSAASVAVVFPIVRGIHDKDREIRG